MSKRQLKLVDETQLASETSFDRKTVQRHLRRAGVKPARTTPAKNGVRRLYDRARALAVLRGSVDVVANEEATRRAKAGMIDLKLRLRRGALTTHQRACDDIEEAYRWWDYTIHARATAAVPYITAILNEHPKGSPERIAAIANIVEEIIFAAEQKFRELRARYARALQ